MPKNVQDETHSSVFRAAFELWVQNTSWKQLLHKKAKILQLIAAAIWAWFSPWEVPI